MKLAKTPTVFVLLLLLIVSQNITAEKRISVLTHGAGEELYSAFGHSAIRVQDTTLGLDNVYNYGVFNSSDPDFLKNFINGKTDYFLERVSFEKYMREYVRDGRYTHEQVLNLDTTEIKRCITLLDENAKEENKYYRYDVLQDNCSTRILDMLMASAPTLEVNDNLNEEKKSYRDWVDQVYKTQNHYWLALGVRIVFGNKANLIPTSKQMSCLPEELENLLYKSSVRGQPLVSSQANLSPDNVQFAEKPFYMRPSFVFPFLAFVLFILFIRTRKSRVIFNVVYFIIGLLGIFLLCLWLFTSNSYFDVNWDLLWASPLFILMPFLKDRKHHWYKTTLSYSLFLALVLQLLLKQPFPPEVIPLIFVLWLSMIRFKRFIKRDHSLFSWKR